MSDTPEILERLRSEPTISIPDYARLLGVSRASGYTYAREGQIPTIKVGRRVRIPSAIVLRQLGLDTEPRVENSQDCMISGTVSRDVARRGGGTVPIRKV